MDCFGVALNEMTFRPIRRLFDRSNPIPKQRAALAFNTLLIQLVVHAGLVVVAFTGAAMAQSVARIGTETAIQSAKPEKLTTKVCRLIEVEAVRNKLPKAYFARLIWKESRFNPSAVSPKGAQGIAQFMPGTASLRGLSDPFDYAEALPASARYLSDLRDQFGNLGLAAAAYNAGENRVRRWLEKRSGLPLETQDYVHSITGLPPSSWSKQPPKSPKFTLAKGLVFQDACLKLASRQLGSVALASTRQSAPWKPWGVQLAADYSRSRALGRFAALQSRFSPAIGKRRPMVIRTKNLSFGRRARYNIRIGEPSRSSATKLCSRLRKLGAACVVLRNRR